MTMLNAIPRGAENRTIVRRGVVILFARIGRLINRWIAAAIARHEREADLFGLRETQRSGTERHRSLPR